MLLVLQINIIIIGVISMFLFITNVIIIVNTVISSVSV